MRYKDILVPALNDLEKNKAFIRGASARLAVLNGMTPRPEDALDVLTEKHYLTYKIRMIEGRVRQIEDGMNELDERSRLVLDRLFIHRKPGAVFDVMEALNVEQAQVYRMKDAALVDLAKVLLGGAEL